VNFILSIPIEFRLAILFILGCCLGSLINLGIYSLVWKPRPISPWSRPPAEAPPRVVWDRLPVFGWFGLRREANFYGGSFWIWVRPMLVEVFCGAAIAFLYVWEVKWRQLVPQNVALPQFFLPANQPGNFILAIIRHQQFVAHVVLFCFMLTAFWTDVDDTTIPDGITMPGTILGLIIVTVWPYALLPQVNNGGPFGVPAISSVWLTSPDELPPPLVFPQPPPRCVQPWDVSAVTGGWALAAAIAVFWVWCLALAPGHWYTRHGYLRAMRIFTARMVREPATYGLIALATVGSIAIAGVWWHGGPRWAGLASGLAGVGIGGGLVWIVRLFASAAMQREAMGFGDVTLLAMIGAFLGWQATIIVFFLAPLVGVVFAIARFLLRREDEIPFGPFLCLAASICVVAWPAIWSFAGEHYFSFGWKLLVVLLGCLAMLLLLLPPVRFIVDRFRGPETADDESPAEGVRHAARGGAPGAKKIEKR
jgi:prepilin signal peptidase PulO-like enzyme (type II secretory pathway)